MLFKPLVSEEDYRIAEADIAAAIEELRVEEAFSSTVAALDLSQCADADLGHGFEDFGPDEDIPDMRADVRSYGRKPSFVAWLRARMTPRPRKAGPATLAKIARTIDYGSARGLADGGRAKGYDAVGAVERLHAMARDPSTPREQVFVLLGWVQAIVAMSCKGVTMQDVEAL